MTPVRGVPCPYDGYFAEGTLFLSPAFLRDYPDAPEKLKSAEGQDTLPEGLLTDAAAERLLICGVLEKQADGALHWIRSVHAPRLLHDVRPMLTGDEYV